MTLGFVFLDPSVFHFSWLLLLPVIIHFTSFRKYKKVSFSNTRLLEHLVKEGMLKRRIKDWLVLFLRLLAMICLLICFANPVGEKSAFSKKKVAVYVDNSIRLSLKEGAIDLLGESKIVAERMAKQYESAEYYFLNNDFSNKNFSSINLEQLLGELSSLEFSRCGKSLKEVKNRLDAIQALEEIRFDDVLLLSDFQWTSGSFFDSTQNIYAVPMREQECKNVFVDSVALLSAGPSAVQGQDSLLVYAYSELAGEHQIGIDLSVQEDVFTQEFVLKEGQNVLKFALPVQGTSIDGYLAVKGGCALYDDRYDFAFNRQRQISVLVASDHQDFTSFFERLFYEDSILSVSYVQMKGLDYEGLEKANVVVVEIDKDLSSGVEALLERCRHLGKTLLVFPRLNEGIVAKNELPDFFQEFTSGIDTVSSGLKFFGDVKDYKGVFAKKVPDHVKEDMPEILRSLSFKNVPKEQQLVQKWNGAPYLLKKENTYVFASSLDSVSSNLMKHPMVVPLIGPLIYGQGEVYAAHYRLGDNIARLPFELPKGAVLKMDGQNSVRVDGRKGLKGFFIPEQSRVNKAYRLVNNDSDSIAIRFNWSKTDVLKSVGDVDLKGEKVKLLEKSALLNTTEKVSFLQGKSYWKYFLLFAIIFFVSELLVVRFV